MKRTLYDVFANVQFDGAASDYVVKIDEFGGWLSRHEAAIFMLVDEVQKSQGIAGDLAELGVWHGRGTILMDFFRRDGEELFAIDIFDLRERSHSHFNDPAIFIENFRKQGSSRNVSIVKIDTARTPELLRERVTSAGFRIFHVDGGHEYRSVRHDTAFAASMLARGGVLVCDDVFARKFPGVTQALIEVLQENPQIVPFAISSKKAWIATEDMAQHYSNHILRRCENNRFRRSEFMGREVLIID